MGFNLASQVTSLSFTASDGTEMEYASRLNFLNGIGYSYMNKGLIIDVNVDYYTLSATYQDDIINTSIKLGYFQPSANLGYAFTLGSFPLRPRIGIGYGYAFLINGDQLTNGTLTDVRQNKNIVTYDTGLNLNAGVMLVKKAGISMSALYNYRMGMTNIESSSNNQETNTTIHALYLKIQLAF